MTTRNFRNENLERLKKYGINDRFIQEANLYKKLTIARVVAQYKGMYKVVTVSADLQAEISGKLRHCTNHLSDYPAVGDYVMISCESGKHAVIHHILSRKSAFTRKAVGISEQIQVVAANIDFVFICMSLNNNYNINRLERYISITFESGATPVIVLTKTDLCENLDAILMEVEKASAFSDIITTSIYDKNLSTVFEKYVQLGMTSAFIGSSGVGKSTLINSILGQDILNTKEVDKHDKGRHTTTGREMFPTPYGGVVIDTPGMREIGIETADISSTFSDIEELAKQCKFSNCSHSTEPGCAVMMALAEEHLDKRRFENYLKIKIESGYQGLNSKEIEEKKLERMFQDVGGMKNARKAIKQKNVFKLS